MAHEIVEELEGSIRLRSILLLIKVVADVWHLHALAQMDCRHVGSSTWSIERRRVRRIIVRIRAERFWSQLLDRRMDVGIA